MKTKKIYQKVISFVLVLVMAVTVFGTVAPEEVQAATTPSFKGKGTSSVTITDASCYPITGKITYIKFKPTVTGYITLKMTKSSAASYAQAEITLCNSKKKTISETKEWWTTRPDEIAAYQAHWAQYNMNLQKANCYTRTYGVKKGTTYYFAVKSSAGIKLSATVKSVKKGTNSSKAKATTLTKNKKATGVIIAGSKTVDWYKINLSTSGRIRLDYTALTNGSVTKDALGIKISFCGSNGKLFISGQNPSSDWVSTVTPSSWSQYYKKNTVTGQQSGLDPGTYYVKVERNGTTASGQYTLKWSTY